MKSTDTFKKIMLFVSSLLLSSSIVFKSNFSLADVIQCSQALGASTSEFEPARVNTASRSSRLLEIRRSLPKVFFDPIPRWVKSINQGEVDDLVNDFKELISQRNEAGIIPLLVSNEAKIAYLEAMELHIREQRSELSSPSVINFLRKKKTKDLLRYVSKWISGKEINRDTFSNIMDLVYLNGHSVLPKEALEQNSPILRLARLRWEGKILELEFNVDNMDSHSMLFRAKQSLYWMSAFGFNALNIAWIGILSFYPRFSFTNFPFVRRNVNQFFQEDNAYSQNFDSFYNRYKGVLRLDLYNSWVRKIAPWILMPVIIYFATNEVALDQMFNYMNTPAYSEARALMVDDYNFLYGEYPSEEAIQNFHEQIFGAAAFFLK